MKSKSKYSVRPRKLRMRGKLGHSTEAEISARWTIRNEYTRRNASWTQVKLEKVVISTVLESKSIKYGRGQPT